MLSYSVRSIKSFQVVLCSFIEDLYLFMLKHKGIGPQAGLAEIS